MKLLEENPIISKEICVLQMTKRLSVGYPYHLVKSGGGRGGAPLLLVLLIQKILKSTEDTCLSFAYTRVVAPRGLHFHTYSHISLSTITEGNKVF